MDRDYSHLDIPDFLRNQSNETPDIRPRRDAISKVEQMSTETTAEITKPKVPVKSKANGAAKPAVKAATKAAGKPKAKAAAKPPAKAKTAPKATAKAAPKASKPKGEATKLDKWGIREGTAKSKAVEMYASKAGATLNEVKDAVGSIQLNVLKGLEAEGHLVTSKKEKLDGKRPVTRYWIKFKKPE